MWLVWNFWYCTSTVRFQNPKQPVFSWHRALAHLSCSFGYKWVWMKNLLPKTRWQTGEPQGRQPRCSKTDSIQQNHAQLLNIYQHHDDNHKEKWLLATLLRKGTRSVSASDRYSTVQYSIGRARTGALWGRQRAPWSHTWWTRLPEVSSPSASRESQPWRNWKHNWHRLKLLPQFWLQQPTTLAFVGVLLSGKIVYYYIKVTKHVVHRKYKSFWVLQLLYVLCTTAMFIGFGVIVRRQLTGYYKYLLYAIPFTCNSMTITNSICHIYRVFIPSQKDKIACPIDLCLWMKWQRQVLYLPTANRRRLGDWHVTETPLPGLHPNWNQRATLALFFSLCRKRCLQDTRRGESTVREIIRWSTSILLSCSVLPVI